MSSDATISPALRTAIQQAMSKAPRCDAETLAPLRAFPMLEVVQGMQPELTAKEPKTVPLALQVLAFAAIEREGETLCTTPSLEVLFTFLVAKVNHFTTIDSAVDATARVFGWYAQHHPKLLTDSPLILKSVINNMLCKISVPSMFGNSKTSAFALLKSLLLPAIVDCFTKEQTKSFLEAFLVSVDGERDPAFVLEVFTMAHAILTSFSASSLSDFTEDYFMTLSNYFPVLFNPPPRCTVTKDQLKDALTEVLVLPVFHEVCIPFVLSKLSSPAEVAKVDSLALLNEILVGVGRRKPSGCCGGEGNNDNNDSDNAACDGPRGGCCSSPVPNYTLPLIEPHLTDILGSLRGEALKLAAAVAFNPSAKDLLRLVMGVTEEVGRLLNMIAGGSSTPEGATASSTKEQRDSALSHCDRMLTACLGAVEAGSDARAYAMLINSLCRSGDAIASVVASYLLPLVGVKIMGLDSAGEGDNAVSAHDQGVFMAAIAIVGGVFSALEMRKNNKVASHSKCNLNIVIKPQTVAAIVTPMYEVASSCTKHPLEDALPLIAEVLSTYLAIRDVMPGSDTVVSSKDILGKLLARACGTFTEADAANVIFRAIGNVGRVATDLVLSATVANSALLYEQAASPRLPSFFADLHRALGDNVTVRGAVIEALILGKSAGTAPLVGTAIDIFGVKSPTIDAYLHALALFAGTEAAAVASSPAIKGTIERILTLGIPEQSSAGADLLCELLARCPEAQQPLLADTDPSAGGRVVSWLCAVSSAKASNDLPSNHSQGIATYYRAQWITLCYSQIAAAHHPTSQTRALALRAIASIAFKVATVDATTFEKAFDEVNLAEGDKASVRSAVSKGLLAKGADPLTTLQPLLEAVSQYGTTPVPIGNAGAPEASHSLLVGAFEQLLSPPFPSSAMMWLQKAYVALSDALLAMGEGKSSAGSPLALVCLASVMAKAPQKVVAATVGTVVGRLVAILEAENTIKGSSPKVAQSVVAINTVSTASLLVITRILDRADGMPLEAVQQAADALLTYTVAAKHLYSLAYTKVANKSTGPAVPMATRDLLVSALLATQAVVMAGTTPSGGSQKSGQAKKISGIAKEAASQWILPWLAMALDDPKRPIRTLAAKCSHEWHKVK